MMKRRHIQSLATLQLLAILAIVASHFWLEDATYLQALCVSFCFLYSGYFTAASHRVDGHYELREHARFMRDKLAKLYPLHLLALALCLLAAYLCWGSNYLFSKVLLAHLTLLSPWIPTPSYYFGVNPVAWFICVLLFLYLLSPLIIRLLRRMTLGWQVAVLMLLIGVEMLAGYADDPASPSLLIPFPAHYYLYEFPLARLLDFATGIVLYHVAQGSWWRDMASRLNVSRATLVEVGAVLLFLAFYWLGKTWLHPHWYRAFCSMVPAVVTLLGAFVLTAGKGGALSRLLSPSWLAVLSSLGAEIYLLQFGVFSLVRYLVERWGLPTQGLVYFLVQSIALLAVAMAVHHGFVKPLYRRLKSQDSCTA